jgi:hypothetical protein
MTLSHHASLLSAVLAGMLVAIPATAEAAQPAEGDPPGDTGGGEGGGDGGEEAAEEGAEEPEGDITTGDEEPTDSSDDEPKEGGAWGVGGTEEEGRYKPRGKTGKLKELEKDDVEERERAEGPPDLPPPGFAYLDTAFGFGEIVVPTQGPGATLIEPNVSFLIGLGYRIGDTWQVGVRFPIATGENDGPANPAVGGGRNPDQFTQIATGALEVGVKPHFILNRELRLPVGLALTFPTAQGDLYPEQDKKAEAGQAIVNQASAASRGWRDRALFAYKRFGIIPSAGIMWKTEVGPGDLNIGAATKVEILIKTGGGEPTEFQKNDEGAEVRSTYVSWLLGGDAYYDFLDGYIGAGLALWFTVANAPEVTGSIDPGGFQFVFEPGLRTHIPFLEDESFGLDGHLAFVLPAGGELGGDNQPSADIWGLRVGAGFFFGM